MENVIKNMNIRPMLERAEFERVELPKQGESINFQISDDVTVKLLNDQIAKVTVARSVVSNPERIFKIYVEMSADVLVEKKYFDELKDPADYFKRTPICRALAAQIANLISNMTVCSAIGPMITEPFVRA